MVKIAASLLALSLKMGNGFHRLLASGPEKKVINIPIVIRIDHLLNAYYYHSKGVGNADNG